MHRLAALAFAVLIGLAARTASAERTTPRFRVSSGLAVVKFTIRDGDWAEWGATGLGLGVAAQPVLPLADHVAVHGLAFVDGVAALHHGTREDGYQAGLGVGVSVFGERTSLAVSGWSGTAYGLDHDTRQYGLPVGLEARFGLRWDNGPGWSSGLDLAVRRSVSLGDYGLVGIDSLTLGYAAGWR